MSMNVDRFFIDNDDQSHTIVSTGVIKGQTYTSDIFLMASRTDDDEHTLAGKTPADGLMVSFRKYNNTYLRDKLGIEDIDDNIVGIQVEIEIPGDAGDFINESVTFFEGLSTDPSRRIDFLLFLIDRGSVSNPGSLEIYYVADFSIDVEPEEVYGLGVNDLVVSTSDDVIFGPPRITQIVNQPEGMIFEDGVALWTPELSQEGSYTIYAIVHQPFHVPHTVAITINVADRHPELIKERVEAGSSEIVRWLDNNWVWGVKTAKDMGLSGKGLKVVETDSSGSDSVDSHRIDTSLQYEKHNGLKNKYLLDDPDGHLYHGERVRTIIGGKTELAIRKFDELENNSDGDRNDSSDTGVRVLLPGLAEDATVVARSAGDVDISGFFAQFFDRSPSNTIKADEHVITAISAVLAPANAEQDADVICSSLGDGDPIVAGTSWATEAGANASLEDEYYAKFREMMGDCDPVIVLTPGNSGGIASNDWTFGGQYSDYLFVADHNYVLTRRGTPDRDWFADRTIIAGGFSDSRLAEYRYDDTNGFKQAFSGYGSVPGRYIADNYLMAQARDGISEYSGEGTSFSQPTISGAVLLLKEKYPNASSPILVKALLNSAWSKGFRNYSSRYHGVGMLDIDGALEWLDNRLNYGREYEYYSDGSIKSLKIYDDDNRLHSLIGPAIVEWGEDGVVTLAEHYVDGNRIDPSSDVIGNLDTDGQSVLAFSEISFSGFYASLYGKLFNAEGVNVMPDIFFPVEVFSRDGELIDFDSDVWVQQSSSPQETSRIELHLKSKERLLHRVDGPAIHVSIAEPGSESYEQLIEFYMLDNVVYETRSGWIGAGGDPTGWPLEEEE